VYCESVRRINTVLLPSMSSGLPDGICAVGPRAGQRHGTDGAGSGRVSGADWCLAAVSQRVD